MSELIEVKINGRTVRIPKEKVDDLEFIKKVSEDLSKETPQETPPATPESAWSEENKVLDTGKPLITPEPTLAEQTVSGIKKIIPEMIKSPILPAKAVIESKEVIPQSARTTLKYNPITAAGAYELAGTEKMLTLGYGHGIEDIISKTPLADQNINKEIAESFGGAIGMIPTIGGASAIVEKMAPGVVSGIAPYLQSIIKSMVTGAGYGLARKPDEGKNRVESAKDDMLLFATFTGVEEAIGGAVNAFANRKYNTYQSMRQEVIKVLKNKNVSDQYASDIADLMINAEVSNRGGWEKVTPSEMKEWAKREKNIKEFEMPQKSPTDVTEPVVESRRLEFTSQPQSKPGLESQLIENKLVQSESFIPDVNKLNTIRETKSEIVKKMQDAFQRADSPEYKRLGNLLLNEQAKEVFEKAKPKQEDLNNIGNSIVEDLGYGRFEGNQKSVKSTVLKVERKNRPDYNILSPKDHARGFVEIDNFEKLPEVVDSIKRNGDFSVESHVNTPMNEFGYRGIFSSTKLGDGINGEIQIHTPQSWAIKLKSDKIFQKWRSYENAIKEDNLPKELIKQYRAGMKASRKLWNDWYEGLSQRERDSISSLERGLESETSASVPSNVSQPEGLSTSGNSPLSIGSKSMILPSSSLPKSAIDITSTSSIPLKSENVNRNVSSIREQVLSDIPPPLLDQAKGMSKEDGIELAKLINNPSRLSIDKRLSLPITEVKKAEKEGELLLNKIKEGGADKAKLFFRSTHKVDFSERTDSGIFFSNDFGDSKNYAGNLFKTEPSKMMIAELDIKNPYRATKDEIEYHAGKREEWVKKLKKEGYDSIVEVKSDNPSDMGYDVVPSEVAVFDKSQIKQIGIVDNPEGRGLSDEVLFKRIESIWNEANSQATPTPLLDQAKGMSKEEFVKAQGEPVYHGSNKEIENFNLDIKGRKDSGWLGRGAYFTSDKELAKTYANLKGGKNSVVMERYANLKNPYYATIKDKERLMIISHRDGIEKGIEASKKWTDDLISKGHDGVILEYKASEVGEKNVSREIVVFDPSQIKTKSQLESIWNEANNGNPPAEPPIKKPTAVSPEDNEFHSRVYERLKEENPDALVENVTYDPITIKNEIVKATNLIKTDKNRAYQIAMGEQDPGYLSTIMNIALSEKALEDGNNTLYNTLVKNRSLAQTRRGQETVSEKASVTNNSVSRYVKELISARLEKLGKDYFTFDLKKKSLKEKGIEKIDKEVSKLQKDIKYKKVKFQSAQEFLDSLICK